MIMLRAFHLTFGVLALAGVLPAGVISTLGDKDCFGLGGSCPDGTRWRDDLGGVFFTSNQTGGDPLFTDIWNGPGGVSYTHAYALPGALVSASLAIKIAGIHDINTTTVYTIFLNGTSIGAIPPNVSANGFQEVLTYVFNVPTGLLTGSDAVSLSGTGGDGYSIDYSELNVVTDVPEPSSFIILGVGLAGLAGCRIRGSRVN